MNKTIDFARTQPRGAVGTIQPVPGKMPLPEISQKEKNAEVMKKFWEARSRSAFIPKPAAVEGGVEIFRSAPVPQAVPLPSAGESAKQLIEARKRLAAAIKARDEAKEEAGKARIVTEAGERAARKIADELAELAGIDSEIAQYHAQKIAAGEPAELSPHLAAKRTKRDRLTMELVDAKGATVLLQTDEAAAQNVLTEAKQHADEAVAAVLDSRVEAMAVAMVAHQEKAFLIKRRLMQLAHAFAGSKRYQLPAAVAAAISAAAEPWTAVSPLTQAEMRDAWRATIAALEADANAPFDANG